MRIAYDPIMNIIIHSTHADGTMLIKQISKGYVAYITADWTYVIDGYSPCHVRMRFMLPTDRAYVKVDGV
jgi:hypothetical protein